MVENVTAKARGVFLWVFLVTELLRKGLTEYDTLFDLKQRLDTFPTDLEVFFKHILETVEPFHHNKMAATLRVALTANGPLNVLLYSFLEQEFEDVDYALHLPLKRPPEEHLMTMCKGTARRINGRCRGLLEVNELWEVNFLHRTVRDFLRLRSMSCFLAAKSPPGFSPNLSILRACTAGIKVSYAGGRVMQATLQDAVSYASSATKEIDSDDAGIYSHLDELDRCAPHLAPVDAEGHSSDTCGRSKFRELTVEHGLVDYLKMKFPRSTDYLAWVSTTSVLRTIFPKFPGLELTSESSNHREQEWPSKTTDLLRCLITHGLDVNEEYYHPRADDATTTLWTTIFSKIIPYDPARFLELGDTFMSFLEAGLFPLFLRHGADRNAKVYRDVSSIGVGSIQSPGSTISLLRPRYPLD